ncbi:MAG: hypothetical protein PHQ58_13095 [Rhodoferax sp.]|nr:hypothetical protein [Rhodoferax sp.]MDD2881364.1 hypothetical protein [Rhodoferax sp.]
MHFALPGTVGCKLLQHPSGGNVQAQCGENLTEGAIPQRLVVEIRQQ